MRTIIPGESRTSFFQCVLGVWGLVFLYAALHNQYLIRIHPEHFTVWHYQMPLIRDRTLLGIAYAFGASISPGLVLGVALFLSARIGAQPKVRIGAVLLGVTAIFILAEAAALAVGWVAWRTGREVFPEWLYPDTAPGLIITQSIQLTLYSTGLILSLLFIIGVKFYRGRLRDHG